MMAMDHTVYIINLGLAELEGGDKSLLRVQAVAARERRDISLVLPLKLKPTFLLVLHSPLCHCTIHNASSRN